MSDDKITNFESDEEPIVIDKKTGFSSFSKGKKIGIIVAAIVLVLVLVSGVYCIVTEQNPLQAVNTITGSNDNKIVGNWESDSNPGISAYVFNEDGTCEQYVLTAAFHWDYQIKGNKLSMINSETSKENVYQITVSGDKLTMKLVKQDDKDVEEGETLLYNKVEQLNQSTLIDAIQNLKDKSDEETTNN